MRTYILVLILTTFTDTFIYSQCEYSNPTSELGIGIVEYDKYNHQTPVFKVYNDPELTKKFCSWNIYDESKSAPFCAKYHKPDYGIVQVVVLDSLTNSYKVLVNKDEVKYVPKTINYVFWSWEEYLTQSHGIRRKIENEQFKNQPILQLPDESSEKIELPNDCFELFCVIDVKGDWIKVKYDCFYNQDQNPNEGMPCSEYIDECENSTIGWLKWRIGNEVVVDIFLMA